MHAVLKGLDYNAIQKTDLLNKAGFLDSISIFIIVWLLWSASEMDWEHITVVAQ